MVHTTINTASLASLIQILPMKWLPEWYSVQVISYNESPAVIVYNATLKGPASFNVISLEPDTVYHISVIPCNMAGCNESCDAYSMQTESKTPGTRGTWDGLNAYKYINVPIIKHIVIFVDLVACSVQVAVHIYFVNHTCILWQRSPPTTHASMLWHWHCQNLTCFE